jgi:DNA-binding NtrC family response regulator
MPVPDLRRKRSAGLDGSDRVPVGIGIRSHASEDRRSGLGCAPAEDGRSNEAEVLARIGFVGASVPFRGMLGEVRRLARVDALVLLQGETGTGKELAARAIHYLGARAARPFIPVDCGALPENLFESEVFGYSRGAFTDARRDMRGLIAQAEAGTLFIDEVHTLSKRSQASLLRFLQDGTYRPLGSERLQFADVRVIAAANCRLDAAVANGSFRADLYFRLSVATLDLPSLRERVEDIPLLVTDFLAKLCRRYRTARRTFDAAALAWLAAQPWLGNVRELEHFVHRAFLRTDADVLTLDGASDACGAGSRAPEQFNSARAAALARFEITYLRNLLAATGGNVSEAARRAGKDRRVFGRLMRRHGIDRVDFM